MLDDPLYKNVIVQKIEVVNYYAKWLSNRCKKIKGDNKNKILKDALKISSRGCLTEKHIFNFEMYLSKAFERIKPIYQ